MLATSQDARLREKAHAAGVVTRGVVAWSLWAQVQGTGLGFRDSILGPTTSVSAMTASAATVAGAATVGARCSAGLFLGLASPQSLGKIARQFRGCRVIQVKLVQRTSDDGAGERERCFRVYEEAPGSRPGPQGDGQHRLVPTSSVAISLVYFNFASCQNCSSV